MTGLCQTCRNVLRVERPYGEVLMWCQTHHAMSMPMPPDVMRCSDYSDARTPSEWEMEKVAWTLNTDKSGRILGFSAPKKEEV